MQSIASVPLFLSRSLIVNTFRFIFENKMAPIKTGGSLSSLQNAIKQLVRGGGNVTHILNVKISRRHLSKEFKSQIL